MKFFWTDVIAAALEFGIGGFFLFFAFPRALHDLHAWGWIVLIVPAFAFTAGVAIVKSMIDSFREGHLFDN